MAVRVFCNGCGVRLAKEADMFRVSLSVATLPGLKGVDPGALADDLVVPGVLCPSCVDGAMRFVQDSEDAADDSGTEAAHLVLGDVVGSPS